MEFPAVTHGIQFSPARSGSAHGVREEGSDPALLEHPCEPSAAPEEPARMGSGGGRAGAELREQILAGCVVIPAGYRPRSGFVLQG